MEQISIKWKMGQDKSNKEIKDFLQFNENECTSFPYVCTKQKIQSAKCWHGKVGEVSY